MPIRLPSKTSQSCLTQTLTRLPEARNRFLGGSMPFGFTVAEDGTLEPVPEQQTAIARMTRMRASGAPYRAISAAMKADGFDLSHEAVRGILARTEDKQAAAARQVL